MTTIPRRFPLPRMAYQSLIDRALAEDLGDAGDLTTLATIPPDRQAEATLTPRVLGMLAGVEVAAAVFATVDSTVCITSVLQDGARLSPGQTILSVKGSAHSLLTAERVALNFLAPMCGIATATAALVDAVSDTKAKIACTRKTLPGLRAIQKYAVRCGGGINHRFGLHDAVMIKDNHIVAAGGITPALRAARSFVGHTVKIEIEVDTLDQLDEVLAEGTDIILLDNMSVSELSEAVRRTAGRAVLEASGNVRLETVRAIAATGVDVISSGAITHSAAQLDIGMEISLT